MLPVLLGAFALSLSMATTDPGEAELHGDLIHSDVPLWGSASVNMWPQNFADSQSFGCQTRLAYGDWKLSDRSGQDAQTWYRLTNYGVIHCFMMVRDAPERPLLRARKADPSFLVELGRTQGRGGEVELWAFQRGARPGSDYLLLARRAVPGVIKGFDVLQRDCPANHHRRGPELSILSTGYCAINSPQELVRLAQRMAELPPLGTLTFLGPAEGDPG